MRTPGYPAGSGIGMIYLIGFTGIPLVLALFLQDGLDYSPLRSGLTVTPFALGVAASAVIAGRLVSRFGRWLTVCRSWLRDDPVFGVGCLAWPAWHR